MGDSVNDSARPEPVDAELIFSEINPPTYQKWLNFYPTDLKGTPYLNTEVKGQPATRRRKSRISLGSNKA